MEPAQRDLSAMSNEADIPLDFAAVPSNGVYTEWRALFRKVRSPDQRDWQGLGWWEQRSAEPPRSTTQ